MPSRVTPIRGGRRIGTRQHFSRGVRNAGEGNLGPKKMLKKQKKDADVIKTQLYSTAITII